MVNTEGRRRMAGSPPGSRLQQMLQSSVQSLQWTYSLFWQLCPQQGVLIWGDGYYNGAIKTRKTVQPMEVSTEEAALQRSQQLKELYESLSAGETNPPARRPCAALSPEDLTESEWFYLMCVSFSFPLGVGLPGNAFVKRQHVWLTGANEADSKVFSRAILAKSANIQTVMCIPLEDGVLELGSTEKIEEDIGLIQHARSFFTDQPHHLPKPALSEHSTSNPAAPANRPLFHPPSLANVLPMAGDPHGSNQEEEELEDDDDDDDEGDAGSDSETETGRESSENAAEMIQHSMAPAQAAEGTEPSEMMLLEMSEDIRLGSPDDCSNNLESELHMLAVGQMAGGQLDDHQHQSDAYQAWPLLHDDLSSGIPQSSGATPIPDLSQEDGHYSQTVSAILQLNSSRWAESCSIGYLGGSQQSAFSSWNSRIDKPLPISAEGTSQWMLKYVMFSVPFLHSKYRDENSPKMRDGEAGNKFRKGTPQEELSANHVLAERRRREKLNERFIILRSLVPFVTKMDKASILGDTIEYVKQLRRQIQDLESENKQMGTKKRPKATEILKSNSSKDSQAYSGYSQAKHIESDRIRGAISDKRKMRVLEEGNGTAKAKAMEASSTSIQVSIIETDALLELQCPYRDGLLLKIIQTLDELLLETITVQSSATNGSFVAELRAKVKGNIQGQRASIVEVKRAIQEIFFQ